MLFKVKWTEYAVKKEENEGCPLRQTNSKLGKGGQRGNASRRRALCRQVGDTADHVSLMISERCRSVLDCCPATGHGWLSREA
jgi:hypothetical protein